MGRPRLEIVNAEGIRPKRATLDEERGRLAVVSRNTALRLYKQAETCTDDESEKAIFSHLFEETNRKQTETVEMTLLLRKDAA